MDFVNKQIKKSIAHVRKLETGAQECPQFLQSGLYLLIAQMTDKK